VGFSEKRKGEGKEKKAKNRVGKGIGQSMN